MEKKLMVRGGLASRNHYKVLVQGIGEVLDVSRQRAFYVVNKLLVKTYWEIGRLIIRYEQKGREKAEYGTGLLDKLSCDLRKTFGKGFSRSNLQYMRLFYIKYPIYQTVSGKLSWSHYIELLGVSNDLSRKFYEKQCVKEGWSVRELSRQVDAMLFERISFSKDRKAVLKLAEKGQIVADRNDIVKDPYIFEFLGIPEVERYTEKELEQKIIDNLQMFLLELGKGFIFVKRQFRITLNNTHFYVDLVFYHRVLRCFVLVDLKIGRANHGDIGQMNMYLNYFRREENLEGDNSPIGLILVAEKDEILVEYALGGISNELFVSRYLLYLPDRKRLRDRMKKLLE